MCDWAQDTHPEVGQRSHLQAVWDEMPRRGAFVRKGCQVKWGRWLSIWDVADEFVPDWHTRLLPLYVKGLREACWESWEQSPLGALTGAAMNIQGGSDDSRLKADEAAAGARESRSVKDSNRDLQTWRGSCKNTMHLVAEIMSNKFTFRLVQVARAAAGPIREAMGDDMHLIGESSGGGLELCQKWSLEGFDRSCMLVFQSLESPQVLKDARFCLDPSEVLGFPSEELSIREDNEVAERFFRLCVDTAGQRCFSSMIYMWGLPHMFSLLLHTESEVVKRTMHRLERLWETLAEVERMGHTDDFFKTMARGMIWPQNHLCRSLLILLEEHKFKVEGCARQRIERLFAGILHTKPIEEVFNKVADASNKARSKHLGRLRRWSVALQSPLIESYGFSSVRPTAASDMCAPKAVSPQVFSGDSESFSLGEERLKEVSDDTWFSPSPATYHLSAMVTAAMLECKGDLKLCKRAWHALLCEPGHMIARKGGMKETLGLVIYASAWGVSVWPAVSVRVRNITEHKGYFKLANVGGQAKHVYRPVFLTSLDDWLAIRVKVYSPLAAASIIPNENSWPKGIVLFPDSEITPLASFSAMSGFRSMSMHHMRKFHELGLGAPRPTTVAAMTEKLIRHFYPNEPDDVIHSYLSNRSAALAPASSVLLEGENLEQVQGFVDTDEINEAKKCRRVQSNEKHKRAVAKAKVKASAKPPAASAGRPSSSSSSAGAKPLGPRPVYSRELDKNSVAEFMPPARGAYMHKETKFHLRWKGGYPREEPPFSFSKVFRENDESNEADSFYTVLRWVWAQHTAATGDAPPFEIGPPLVASAPA